MRKGFSLLEMLIYLALVAIIGTILLNFIFTLSQSFNKARVKREVLSNARLALEKMMSDVKSANSVYTPTSVFDSPEGHLSMETLVNLPSGEKRTYFDYYVSSSRVYLKRDGQSPQAITSGTVKVSSLIFTYLKNGTGTAESVEIQMTVLSATPTREDLAATTSLTSSASVRGNY